MKELWTSALSLLRKRSDEESMSRVKATGDHEEFSRLARKWEEPIRRLCARMTGDEGRGEELKQETFLKVYQHRKAYEPAAKFSTFLWRIAVNLCHDEFRRQERRRQFLEPRSGEADDTAEAVDERPGPDLHAACLEERELVRAAVLRLPDIYRTVIVLRHYEDLKLAQIAEILDVPEGTVNSRMAEALNKLSRALAPQLQPESKRAVSVSPLTRLESSTIL